MNKLHYLSRDNLLVDLDGLVSKEWWITSGHFIDKHSQSPPIHCLVVALGEDDFRSEVFRCATQGPCATFDLLGKTKIGDFNIALMVDKQILRF